jgi:hypothetical protein
LLELVTHLPVILSGMPAPPTHLEPLSVLAAGPVQNPGPEDPTNGSNGVTLLLAYAKWGALIACAGAALASGGLMAVGSLSNRPDHADRGKRALLWSLGGVVITAIAIPVINTVFGAVH